MTFAAHLGVGEHPRNAPDDAAPCATCRAKAAGTLAGAALEMMTDDRDFPAEATREFLDRFGDAWKEMAAFLYDAAYDATKKDDNEDCYAHRPTKEDEE